MEKLCKAVVIALVAFGLAGSPVASAKTSTTTVYGAAIGQPLSGETIAQATTRVTNALGNLPYIRVYGNTLSQALNVAKQEGWPQRHVVISWKPTDFSPAAQQDFLSAAKQLTKQDYICMWHEQDNKINDGLFTANWFLTMWHEYHDLAKANGVVARWMEIFMGYNIQTYFPQQYVGNGYTYAIGIDPYTKPGQTAYDKISPIVNYLHTQVGKPIAVTETGVHSNLDSDKIAYVKTLGALQGMVSMVLYFNVNKLSAGQYDFRIDDVPDAANFYKTLVGS